MSRFHALSAGSTGHPPSWGPPLATTVVVVEGGAPLVVVGCGSVVVGCATVVVGCGRVVVGCGVGGGGGGTWQATTTSPSPRRPDATESRFTGEGSAVPAVGLRADHQVARPPGRASLGARRWVTAADQAEHPSAQGFDAAFQCGECAGERSGRDKGHDTCARRWAQQLEVNACRTTTRTLRPSTGRRGRGSTRSWRCAGREPVRQSLCRGRV